MKKFQIFSGAALLVLATSASVVQAVEYVAADDNPASKLCVSAAMDKPVRFMVEMRDLGINKRYAANQVTCNGINMTTFAHQTGNTGNYKMLSHYRRGHVEINDLAQTPATDEPPGTQ